MLKRLGTVIFYLLLIGIGLGSGFALWGKVTEPQATTTHVAHIVQKFPERQFWAPIELQGEDKTSAKGEFLVDTGATVVTISGELYDRLHLVALRDQVIEGVTGKARTVVVRIPEMRIGDIVVRNVEAVVSHGNLLGMTFLEQMKRVSIEENENHQYYLTLEQ